MKKDIKFKKGDKVAFKGLEKEVFTFIGFDINTNTLFLDTDVDGDYGYIRNDNGLIIFGGEDLNELIKV